VFDRIEVIQGAQTFTLKEEDYLRIDRLHAAGAPEFKEISIFRLRGDTGFDPARLFRIEVSASRKTADGDTVSMRIPLDYALPRGYLLAAAPVDLPEDMPLWEAAWQAKVGSIIGVAVMLVVLAGLMFLQEPFARRPALWRWGRIGYLTVTLVWLGWIAGGQLSVVQVVAFLHSLLSGFHWETFLIEPVIFLLWGFVALGLLFWGRGVYCGWLCPFGALQEITNEAAQRLGVPQIQVPFAIHERLWAIKYTLFLAILALSFYSMEQALMLAEAEPFKTAMSMRFIRAWPFVLFVVALLAAGLFIERFYCRYLCPLGAALAIPAKLKLFDWLSRRPQCGRECRLCETKCTVGAIDPIGRINPNECVLCLRCQMIYHDPKTCTVLKNRVAREARARVNT
jgi:NosR/NirI family nitrite reductase transcriptional regulator